MEPIGGSGEGEKPLYTLPPRMYGGRGARKILQPRLHQRTKRAARSARAVTTGVRHLPACSTLPGDIENGPLIHVAKQQYQPLFLLVSANSGHSELGGACCIEYCCEGMP